MKTIALIAHDNLKDSMVEWALNFKDILSQHQLFATGTTGKKIQEATGLEIVKYRSGPHGGDQQIGAAISEGRINTLVFFWDPLSSQPHDVDVKALLRIATVYDIPMALNRASADILIKHL